MIWNASDGKETIFLERNSMDLSRIRKKLAAAKKTSERKHYKVAIAELCGVVNELILVLEDTLTAIEFAVEKPTPHIRPPVTSSGVDQPTSKTDSPEVTGSNVSM